MNINFKNILEHLVELQKDIKPISKDAQGRTGNQIYKYAPYSAIRKSIEPALTKHNFAVIHKTQTRDGTCYLSTFLIHKSGEYMSSEIPIKIPDDPKVLGSLQSYYSRYQLCALLGLVTDDDDDGDKVSESINNTPLTQTSRPINEVNKQSKGNASTIKNPGDIVVPFGRDQGKKICDIDFHTNLENLKYWTERLATDGQPPRGKLKAYIDALNAYVKLPPTKQMTLDQPVPPNDTPPMPEEPPQDTFTEDDIPF